MALPATAVVEIRSTATASNVNGGGFNPANANGITGSIASGTGNSPTLTSGFYSFTASDVGAWVYFPAQANINSGWYQIASQSSGVATLSAAIGQAVTSVGSRLVANTVAGCATTASPSGVTFLVDYTQNDTAIVTYSAALGSLNGSTTLTDNNASSLFTPVMVGNFIRITAGTNFTVGWYEIVQFTDANNVILDRTPHGANTASAGTGRVGGALSLGSSDDAVFEMGVSSATGSFRWFAKNGTYSTTAIDISVSGNAAAPFILEGYNTMRGDRPLTQSGNQPIFACGANAFNFTGKLWQVNSVSFTTTASLGIGMAGSQSAMFNVKIQNKATANQTSMAINATGSGCAIWACDMQSYRGYALNSNASGLMCMNNYLHDSGAACIRLQTSPCFISNNIIMGAISNNILGASAITAGGTFSGNTIYGSQTPLGTGINFLAATSNVYVTNNIFYGLATGVSHGSTQITGIDDYNNYYNNTNDVSSAAAWQKGSNDIAVNPSFTSVGEITGTAGAFVAGNSRLVDTTKNFSALGVVPGRDYLYISAGTGVTNSAMWVGITGFATTTNTNDTLVLDIAQGTNTTADKVYQITIGRNFAVGTALNASGYPGVFPGGTTTGYLTMGAPQRQSGGGGGSSSYTFS